MRKRRMTAYGKRCFPRLGKKLFYVRRHKRWPNTFVMARVVGNRRWVTYAVEFFRTDTQF